MIIEINSPGEVGIVLKNLRKKHRLSQVELAKEVSLSAHTILRYEASDYLQASSVIVFSILAFFAEKEGNPIILSITPSHGTISKSVTDSSIDTTP